PEAESLLKSEMANMPKDSRPALELATLYLQTHREPAMSEALQGILNKPKDFPDAHAIVGDFYNAHQKWDDAMREYAQGLSGNSKDSAKDYRKRMAKTLIAEGKRDDAIEQLTQVVQIDPEDADARLARAILLRESKDPGK